MPCAEPSAYILLGLAGFLVTAAILALVWVPGQVKKTPLDVNTTTKLTGNAAVLPTGPGSAVKAIQRTVADGAASTSDVVVFDTFSCLVQDPDGTTPRLRRRHRPRQAAGHGRVPTASRPTG